LPTPQLAPRPSLPRPGRALADALALTDHCIERYRARARRSGATVAELRSELADVIARKGVAVKRPPAWFFGGRGATAFYVTVDGQWVLPAQPARLVDGALPARPYVVTTFITRDISEADLAEFTGEELAALIKLPPRVVGAWRQAADDDEQPAEQRLRDAIAATGSAHRDAPAWLRSRKPAPDRFFVSLDDGTLLVVSRTRRDEGHRAPFRATDLLYDDAVRQLAGEELLATVRLEARVVLEYARAVPGVPDDARGDLERRIISEGRVVDELPAWLAGAGRVT